MRQKPKQIDALAQPCIVSAPESPSAMGTAVFDGFVTGSVSPGSSSPTITCYWWRDGGADPTNLAVGTADQYVVADLDPNMTGVRRDFTAHFNLSAVASTTTGYVRVVYVLGMVTRTFHFPNLSWTQPAALLNADKGKDDSAAAARAALAAILDPVLIQYPDRGAELEPLFVVYGKYRAGDDGENFVQVTLHHEVGTPVLALVTDAEYLPSGSDWAVAVQVPYESGERYVLRATLRNKFGTVLFRHPVSQLTIHG